MTTPRVTVPVIRLTAHEIQSGYDRQAWAEALILQLPDDHDGRNSWLINYGETDESAQKRSEWNAQAIKDGRKPSCAFNHETRSTGSAAPAPEGGAVSSALDWLEYGLREEWGPDSHHLACLALDRARAALATREEAPAEAGALVNQIDALLAIPEANLSSRIPYLARELLERSAKHLRAQPPAREDAQPVAVKALVDAALTYIAGKGHAPGFGPLGKLHEAAWAVKRSPLYTHPAPDALRVREALSALVIADGHRPSGMGNTADWIRNSYGPAIALARQALAALQAEQGAK